MMYGKIYDVRLIMDDDVSIVLFMIYHIYIHLNLYLYILDIWCISTYYWTAL